MKLSIAFGYAISALSLTSTAEAKDSSSLRGRVHDQRVDNIDEGPFAALKCTIEGKTSQDVCSTAITDENEPCSYCTLAPDEEDKGLCVNPEIAAQMKQLNPQVVCDGDVEKKEKTSDGSKTKHILSSTASAAQVEGPFSDLKCLFEAKGDEDACSAAVTDDGEPCSYCSTTQNGEESGLCVNPDVAEKMVQINTDISCTNIDDESGFETKHILSSTASMAQVEGPFSDLKCLFEAKGDEDACSAAVTDDGEPCSYCSTTQNGEESGLCVNPDVAEKMVQINTDISCTNIDDESGFKSSDILSVTQSILTKVEGPFSDLKCLFEAKGDEDACSAAVTDDGEPCSYCSTTQNGEESGLCVNPDVAEKMVQINTDISCTNIDDVETDVQFDKADYKCTIEALNDAEKCASAKTEGDDWCEYCSMDGPFGTQGVCVSPEHAEKLEGLVGDKISCISHSNVLGGSFKPSDVLSVTQSILTKVEGPFSDLVCLFEGKENEDKCASSVTDDGEPCSFCTTTQNGQKGGLCVNPDVAQQMIQMNPTIACTNIADVETDVQFDKADYKCTIEALNDAEKCASAKTEGDDWCEYCSMDGPFGTQGVCVSPEHAEKLEGLVGDKISCISHNEAHVQEPLQSSPIKDCNIDGIDNVTCLDPSKVNGSECTWCDAGIGGFCFPKSWEEKASHFLSCTTEVREVKEELEPEDVKNNLKIDPSFLSSSCFKVGLTGASPDDCRAALDDKTGEHCIFCNSPNLFGLGLCMTPEFKGNEGQFYTCDADMILAEA